MNDRYHSLDIRSVLVRLKKGISFTTVSFNFQYCSVNLTSARHQRLADE